MASVKKNTATFDPCGRPLTGPLVNDELLAVLRQASYEQATFDPCGRPLTGPLVNDELLAVLRQAFDEQELEAYLRHLVKEREHTKQRWENTCSLNKAFLESKVVGKKLKATDTSFRPHKLTSLFEYARKKCTKLLWKKYHRQLPEWNFENLAAEYMKSLRDFEKVFNEDGTVTLTFLTRFGMITLENTELRKFAHDGYENTFLTAESVKCAGKYITDPDPVSTFWLECENEKEWWWLPLTSLQYRCQVTSC